MAEGIDLAEHYELTVRLFRARFSQRIAAAGCDPDDALQAVFRGILTRNRGSNPWREYRGGRSASSYIYMVMDSVLKNHVAKQRRYRERNRLGAYSHGADDRRSLHDVASVDWPDDTALPTARMAAADTVAMVETAAASECARGHAARRLLREIERSGISNAAA